ncbi:sensor histidine kinase [Allofournierella sp.]|uniref:sensor histidine kinase n=1 Tax=Allofournierella sp. TaxID=1940256 RepID=UPI003AB529AC
MLKGLHLRLAALFTALTALVLAGALAVAYRLAAAQYATGRQALHQAALAGLTAQLSQGRVSHAWLAELEASGPYLALIEDGGRLLNFAGAAQSATSRAELWRRLRGQMAAGMGEGLLAGAAGEEYSVQTVTLRPGGGRVCLAALLRPLAGEQAFLRRLAAQYLALGLAGFGLLTLIGWVLAGLALRPTRRALQRQTEFVAAASHELRSPLAVITASLQAARGAPQEAPALLAAAERESNRLARLADDLLCLTSADAQRWAVHSIPTSLDTFCVDLFERFAPLAARRGLRFALDLPPSPLPCVLTDPERLAQLLGIFVDNALEYAPAGTAVTLSVRTAGRRVRLTVRDEGPGIAPADRERVWERFYRGDASRSSKHHAGLGLAVARELAHALNTRLTVGDAPGGGAAFSAELGT